MRTQLVKKTVKGAFHNIFVTSFIVHMNNATHISRQKYESTTEYNAAKYSSPFSINASFLPFKKMNSIYLGTNF
jgi:hypothetical protein